MMSLTPEELSLLRAFNSNGIRFLIIGLSSAVLQGTHAVTEDVDLWFESLGTPEFMAAVKSVGAFYIPPGLAGMNPPMFGPGQYRIFDIVTYPHGLADFATEYSRGVDTTIDSVPLRLLPLERVILSKEAANREKDRAVLPALKAALAIKNTPPK